MKKLFDYLPLIVFFGVYFTSGKDIMLATWGILLASILQISVGWLLWRKVEQMHGIVFLFTAIFGGLTLALNDEIFIKWRPSVINFSFAVILLGGQLLRERGLLQRICESLMISGLGYILPLSRRDWNILNTALVLYFLFIAALNLYVAYNFSTEFWVNFKLIGFTLLNFIFYISLFLFIYKRLPEEDRQRLMSQEKGKNTEGEKGKDALRDHQ